MTCWRCGQTGHYANHCTALPLYDQRGPPASGQCKQNGSVENECGFCHKKDVHLSIDCPNKPMPKEQLQQQPMPPQPTQQQQGAHYCLQNPNHVPGMAPGLIQEECEIEGVSNKAIADCRAATSVVTQEFAYSVYKTVKQFGEKELRICSVCTDSEACECSSMKRISQ